MKRVLLFLSAGLVAGCTDTAGPAEPSFSDYVGVWRLTPDTSSPDYGNCNNLNANSGGVHFTIGADDSFQVITSNHDAGYGAFDYRGSLTGSLTPPSRGTLRFARPGGEGRFTASSVSPSRIEGSFFSDDQGFANPSFGQTPCAFDAVLTKE